MQDAIRNGNGSLIRFNASARKDWPMGAFLFFDFLPPFLDWSLVVLDDGRVDIHLSNRNGLLISSSSPPFCAGDSSSTTISICDNPTPMAARCLRALRSVKSSLGMVTYLSRDDNNSSDAMLTIACCPDKGIDAGGSLMQRRRRNSRLGRS